MSHVLECSHPSVKHLHMHIAYSNCLPCNIVTHQDCASFKRLICVEPLLSWAHVVCASWVTQPSIREPPFAYARVHWQNINGSSTTFSATPAWFDYFPLVLTTSAPRPAFFFSISLYLKQFLFMCQTFCSSSSHCFHQKLWYTSWIIYYVISLFAPSLPISRPPLWNMSSSLARYSETSAGHFSTLRSFFLYMMVVVKWS